MAKKGKCPVCLKERPLNKKGVLKAHIGISSNAPSWARNSICDGFREKPKPP